MKLLDKLISFLFSIIMLVVAVVLILVGTGAIEAEMIIDMLRQYVFVENTIKAELFNPVTISGIVLACAALKTTVFLSFFKQKDRSPILVKTQNGEVEIGQETVTSTVKNVAFSFENVKDVQAKMVKKNKAITIYVMLLLYANSNIREITEQMQAKIRETLKATTGVNVKEVNIKVKNISQTQRKQEDSHVEVVKGKQEVTPIEVENGAQNVTEEENNSEGTNEKKTEETLLEVAANEKTENAAEEIAKEQVVEKKDSNEG